MANYRRPADKSVRDAYMERERTMTALIVRLSDPAGTTYDDGLPRAVPDGGAAAMARLTRLESGERARVQGWQIGLPCTDFSLYLLDADGRAVPARPVVANGVLYVLDIGTSSNLLRAYSAVGTTNCSGSPLSCQPLWTATLQVGGLFPATPAVANGVVYVVSDTILYAFDQNGTTNCSGTPKVCTPLWQALYGASDTPTVANGVVYVNSGSGIAAYDAAGATNCSGSPKVCTPLWVGTESASSAATGSPTYANGVVYISAGENLYAFDGAGHTGCSGTPTACVPLWSASLGAGHLVDPTTAVSAGTVYAVNSTTSVLYAFDATGTSGCSGSPKTCSALWTASGVSGSPAIARGTLYIVGTGGINAYDATGTTDCSGSPKVCTPLRSYPGGASISGGPVVANDVLYSTANSATANGLVAFDANGSSGCSGTPVVCKPLFSTVAGAAVFGDAAVANGVAYFADGDPFSSQHQLFALNLP